MPSVQAVYASIARACEPLARYAEGDRGPVRVQTRLTGEGVRELDRAVVREMNARPGLTYAQAAETLTINGKPLEEPLWQALRQLQEARRSGLLRPGDESR